MILKSNKRLPMPRGAAIEYNGEIIRLKGYINTPWAYVRSNISAKELRKIINNLIEVYNELNYDRLSTEFQELNRPL